MNLHSMPQDKSKLDERFELLDNLSIKYVPVEVNGTMRHQQYKTIIITLPRHLTI